MICFKQNEERLIIVTPKGCSTLKTYCRKLKYSSLLKLIEKCENNTSKKVKVSLWCLLFSMTYVATKNISMLRTHKRCFTIFSLTITLIFCKYCIPNNLSFFKTLEMFNLLRQKLDNCKFHFNLGASDMQERFYR